jgi:hypothetical protein
VIPDTVGQDYDLVAVFEGSEIAHAVFTVMPSTILTPTAGPSDTIVTIEGHGFKSGIENDLAASFDGADFTVIINDYDTSTGWFTATGNVPSGQTSGGHAITFFEADPDPPYSIITSASATFTITLTLPLPEYPLGALLSLLACFGTFVLYNKRGSLPQLKRRN